MENNVINKTIQEKPYCVVCKVPLSDDRIEALNVLETPREQWRCLQDAPNQFKKAVYAGESGTSPLIFVDSVDNKSNIPLDDFGVRILEKELNKN